MKLIKCYVSSFGKLKNFSMDFNDGLNTIKEDNGWGKSTLASFIKIMFYGINDTKKTIKENERMKFHPWNSTEKFGGYLIFLWGEKEYKIERYFGSKSSEDTVKLYDVATGKEYPNTLNLGQRIFKIDEEGFLSTTYFSEKDFEIKSNSSLTAKFNSACDIKDSDAYDSALKKLDEKSKFYKGRGDKGIIATTKHQITELESDIVSADSCLETVTRLRRDAKQLNQQITALNIEINNLNIDMQKASNQIATSDRKEIYLNLLEKKKITEQKIKDLDRILKGNRTSKDEINAYLECVEDFNKIKTDILVAKKDIETLRNSKNENAKKNKDFIFLIISIIMGIVCVSGVVVLFFDFVIGLVLALTGFVTSSVSILIYMYIKKRFRSIKGASENIISTRLKTLHSYDDMYGEYFSKISYFLNKFGYEKVENINAVLYEILSNNDEIIRLEKELESINSEIEKYSEIKDCISDKNNNVQLDFECIKKSINEKIVVRDNLNKQLSIKNSNIKFYEDTSSDLNVLESKKSDLINKLNQYEEEYKIVLTTIKYLKKADENLKTKYRSPLMNSLNKYLSFIDHGNNSANIDIDLNVTITEQSGEKSTDYYSKGYQNLFEICKRFALTDVLFTAEKPFIILDDPFYNLDDKKIKSSLDLIKNLSEEYQIIYFVCHDSRKA